MLFQSYFFKINTFFQGKKNHFYKNPNKKEREPFLKSFTKKQANFVFFFQTIFFSKYLCIFIQVSFKFFMHGCFESSFLRIASLQVCAYGSILLNQQAPIKLTCYPPRFLALMFFLLCFCMINEKNMVNGNKVLSFLLSLFYFYIVNIHMLNIQYINIHMLYMQ